MVVRGCKIKTSTYLKLGYLILLVTAFFYVKSVLDIDSFKATEKQAPKQAVKVEDVTVNLITDLPEGVKEYKATMKNTNSVKDLLDALRDKQGLLYESDLYTYGTEIVTVFDKEADLGKKWAVLVDNKDITANISNTYLTDKARYELQQLAK